MTPLRCCFAVFVSVLLFASSARAALGDRPLLGRGAPDELVLVKDGAAAPVHVAAGDWPGVQRAARDLQADLERVTGVKPAFSTETPADGATVFLFGTIGRSALIDGLMASGILAVDDVRV